MRNFFLTYKHILVLVAAVKIACMVLLATTYSFVPFSDFDYAVNGYHYQRATDPLSRSLAAYDGQWYLHIAEKGYRDFPSEREQKQSYAFFPLYPLLIALVAPLFGGHTLLAALAISIISAFAGAILLYAIAKKELPPLAAYRSVWYFLIFPSAIFFMVAYTEALFFALSLASMYAARRARFGSAGVWAYLAALARPQGVLLFFPLAIEWWLQCVRGKPLRSALKKITAPLAAPLGLATYYGYLYIETGNFFAHLQSNAATWGRSVSSPLDTVTLLAEKFRQFLTLPFHSFQYSQLDLIVVLVFGAMTIMIARQLRLSYAVYAILLIVFPLMTGSTMSMVRYAALSFPHFLILGSIGARWQRAHMTITAISLLLAVLLGIRFVHWYWAG